MRVALFSFVVFLFSLVYAQPSTQIDALVDLYDATDGDNWFDNYNWLIGSPCAHNWFGVTCDSSQNVTSL